MSRPLELLGAVGGSVGLVYAAGYLVLAGHYRVLGVPVPSADSATLTSNAWEFLFQGTVVSVHRGIESTVGLTAILAILLTVVLLLAVRRRPAARPTRWIDPVARLARERRTLAAVTALVVAWEVYVLLRYVLPAGMVVSLLSGARPASPFIELTDSWFGFIDRDWHQLREALIGTGTVPRITVLSRLYAVYLVSVSVITAVSFVLWQRARPLLSPALTIATMVAVALALVLVAHAPVYYGVTLKTYRYPLVVLVPATDDHPDGVLAMEIDRTRSKPVYLLGTSSDDYYVYERTDDRIYVLKRSVVGMVKIGGSDFVFGTRTPGGRQ